MGEVQEHWLVFPSSPADVPPWIQSNILGTQSASFSCCPTMVHAGLVTPVAQEQQTKRMYLGLLCSSIGTKQNERCRARRGN